MCQDCIFHAGRLVALRRERPCLRAARHHRRAAPQDSSEPETSLPKSQVASRFTEHFAVAMLRSILFSEPQSFDSNAHAWRRIWISEKAGSPHSAAVLPGGPLACRADIQQRGIRECLHPLFPDALWSAETCDLTWGAPSSARRCASGQAEEAGPAGAAHRGS